MELVLQDMGPPAKGGEPATPTAEDGRDPTPAVTPFAVMAGTSIGPDPMTPAMVRRYRTTLDRALARCHATLFAHGRLDASYTHDSGIEVSEHALVRAGVLPTREIGSLRVALARTASAFSQETIGLLIHSPGIPSTVRPSESFGPLVAGRGDPENDHRRLPPTEAAAG